MFADRFQATRKKRAYPTVYGKNEKTAYRMFPVRAQETCLLTVYNEEKKL